MPAAHCVGCADFVVRPEWIMAPVLSMGMPRPWFDGPYCTRCRDEWLRFDPTIQAITR